MQFSIETSSNPLLSFLLAIIFANFILDPKLFTKGLTSKLRKSEAINYCFAERDQQQQHQQQQPTTRRRE